MMGENKVLLMVPNSVPVEPAKRPTEEGEAQSLGTVATGAISKIVEISPDLLRKNIQACLEQMRDIFTDLSLPTVNGWKVENISVGLSISAEGSVGVASVGAEASIEIGFAPK
ncbi:MAG: hypothetical protein ABSE46_19355 [Terracidiphilus sp.]|jgi:hypothetical protein